MEVGIMYTSYFGNMKKLPEGYNLISISRMCPKGIKVKMYGKLAPSAELLRDYKSGLMAWADYTERYKSETLSKLDPHVVAKELGENAILLCYEKSNDNCHRHIVAEWLREAGIQISEY